MATSLVLIDWDDGLLLVWCYVITWSNADLLARTYLIENLFEIHRFLLKKMQLKMLSANVGHFVQGSKCESQIILAMCPDQIM